jgi:hypothetical protein
VNQFLDHEIVLVLAKYGERPVLTAIAKRLGLTAETLEQQLALLGVMKPKPVRAREPVDTSQVVKRLASEYPSKAAKLELLFARFQNRTFLPELRHVRRFFEQHGCSLGKIKSRAQIAPRLFKLLGTLELSELDSLSESVDHERRSSLGIISDQVLRRSERG